MGLISELQKPWKAYQRWISTWYHLRRIAPLSGAKPRDYAQYLQTQLDRTLGKLQQDIVFHGDPLIETMLRFQPARQSVLCVGCRTPHELHRLREVGFQEVVGIDLFSQSPLVRVMDMHKMSFADHSFDVVFASHSLEHALVPEQVADEISRVVKGHGLVAIEVPVSFATTEADLHDFGDEQGVLQLFGKHVAEVKWAERQPPHSERNGHGTAIVRTVFQAPAA